MSAFNIPLIDCPELQTNLDAHYSVANYTQYFDIPLVMALTSEANMANLEGIQQLVSSGNGKIRRVESLYTPRLLESEISESIDPSCSSENQSGRLSKECEIDITQGVYHSEIVGDIAALAPICESNPAFLARRIASAMDGLMRKLETKTHTQLLAQRGGFSANDTQSLITADVKEIIVGASGTPSPAGLAELRYTLGTLYQSRVWLFGQGLAAKYFDALGDGCCADVGVDLGSFYGGSGLVFFKDFRAEAATDTDGFFGLIPGAAHLVYYNRYAGDNAITNNPVRSRFTLNHGPTGLPVDVGFKLDCDDLVMEAFLATAVCAAPTDMFAIGDELNGYNGILEFLAAVS